ncbi:hypothetical protein TRAPUB_9672 [Trametes pubescens]|uniref:Uncharacterized protein n=1 Tax=Trametes pubescens TaxID=154538 RepID=A0A1M2W1N8_TRAPU|nr:hypothetical protein TRAPUB_9672 [Trametes pubescens]
MHPQKRDLGEVVRSKGSREQMWDLARPLRPLCATASGNSGMDLCCGRRTLCHRSCCRSVLPSRPPSAAVHAHAVKKAFNKVELDRV